MPAVKALICDTGGTILDWHSGIAAKLSEIGKRRRLEANWEALTNELRMRSLRQMTGGGPEFKPSINIDSVHREQIEFLARENGLSSLAPADFVEIRDAWHSLKCWPDVPGGLACLRQRHIIVSLTILSFRLIIDTCKSSGIVWDAVFSCEAIGAYKPRPQVYRQAAAWLQLHPSECLMVASHASDLAAAASQGFQTALVRRPTEWGSTGEPLAIRHNFQADVNVDSFYDLADALERQL